MEQFDGRTYETMIAEAETAAYDSPLGMLRRYMEDEERFVRRFNGNGAAVDIGAGYGRMTPVLIEQFNRVVAVEKNDSMFEKLEQNTRQMDQVTSVHTDASDLESILAEHGAGAPTVCMFQNTPGTWDGDFFQFLRDVHHVAHDVILSVFRKDALKRYGVPLYEELEPLCGAYAAEQSQFEQGIYRTDRYTSQWWSDEEIRSMREILGKEREWHHTTPAYHHPPPMKLLICHTKQYASELTEPATRLHGVQAEPLRTVCRPTIASRYSLLLSRATRDTWTRRSVLSPKRSRMSGVIAPCSSRSHICQTTSRTVKRPWQY